jgi:hypothetical protein
MASLMGQTTTLNGEARRFIGDDRGWLYAATPRDKYNPTSQVWVADINLHPESEVCWQSFLQARVFAQTA